MKNVIGTLLRAVGMVWIIGASLRLMFAVSSGGYRQGEKILVAILALVISAGVFWLGTWLKRNANTRIAATAISSVRRSWWSATLLFRAYVILSVAWLIGAFYFDDGYDTNWSLVVGPPVALLLLYIAFMKLVLGSPDASATVPMSLATIDPMPPAVDSSLQPRSPPRSRTVNDIIREIESNR
jgi:hypothetical protein